MEFTLLKKEQVIGDGALDVMKNKQSLIAAPTDLALVLGVNAGHFRNRVDDNHFGKWTNEVACCYWTTSHHDREDSLFDVFGNVNCISNIQGCVAPYPPNSRRGAVRPVLSPEEASKIIPSKARAIDRIREGINRIRVVEYGEYPQTIANKRTSKKLESLYESGSLRPTGKDYTFDSVHPENKESPFKAISYPEYELDGKRYIRVLSSLSRYAEEEFLSNGEKVINGREYWVQVEPIKWLVDPKGTMVAQKSLFAGIQFDTKKKYDGDFSKTFMKHYLDNYFAKEMMPLERTNIRENATDKTDDAATKRIKEIKMQMLRTIAAENVSPEKGVVNRKRPAAEKQIIRAALDRASKGIGK